jgi:hypothetical protein
MPELHIILEGDGAFRDWQNREQHHTLLPMRVSALEAGMESGDPSIMIGIELENGEVVMAETSLRLFLTAADAFRARYGDPRQGEFGGGKTILGGRT